MKVQLMLVVCPCPQSVKDAIQKEMEKHAKTAELRSFEQVYTCEHLCRYMLTGVCVCMCVCVHVCVHICKCT